jgi:hypothetical protein
LPPNLTHIWARSSEVILSRALTGFGFPLLVIVGLSGCKASLNAEANASASGADASAEADADAEANLVGGEGEAAAQDDLDKPIESTPTQEVSKIESEGPALLGARRDLTYNGPKTERCSCIAAKLGTAGDPAFQWEKGPPLLDESRQLVAGLTSDGVSCAQERGLGASYKGYVRSGSDIVIMVERAHEGRPVTSGAIIPRPVGAGQVFVVAAEKGSPFGGAVGKTSQRCQLELPAGSQVAVVDPSETGSSQAVVQEAPPPEGDEEGQAGGAYVDIEDAAFEGESKPPPAPRQRDGFFLSLLPALDYMHMTQRGADVSYSGFGLGLDFVIGGSLSEGVHLGLSLGGATFPTPDLKVQGATISNNADLNWFHIGGVLDYYFSSDAGTHLLAELGYAQLATSGNRGESQDILGFGVGLGLGHDWWVADNWSIGLLARFTFAALNHRQADTDHLLLLPGLNFTATYH